MASEVVRLGALRLSMRRDHLLVRLLHRTKYNLFLKYHLHLGRVSESLLPSEEICARDRNRVGRTFESRHKSEGRLGSV